MEQADELVSMHASCRIDRMVRGTVLASAVHIGTVGDDAKFIGQPGTSWKSIIMSMKVRSPRIPKRR